MNQDRKGECLYVKLFCSLAVAQGQKEGPWKRKFSVMLGLTWNTPNI